MNKKNVVLLGASGLVGYSVLNELLLNENVTYITALVRKPLEVEHPKLQQIITKFQDLSSIPCNHSIDVLYSCIGTTRKKTPNLVEYKAIDYGITMAVASYAKAHGCKEIHLVSSVGANQKSSNFYLKIKGEVEEGIVALGFDNCLIYRPSMLIGERNESRPAEKFGQRLTPFFDVFTFKGKYHSINAKVLAKAMCNSMQKPGISILHYREIMALI